MPSCSGITSDPPASSSACAYARPRKAPRSRPSTSYSSSGVGAAGRRYQGKCTVSTVLSSSCFTLIRVKTTVN